MSDSLDLGHGFSLRYYVRGDAVPEDRFWEGVDAGLRCYFLLERGEELIGSAPVSGPGTRWTVVSRSPLTLSPSLLCQPANVHGYIREGRWVPC